MSSENKSTNLSIEHVKLIRFSITDGTPMGEVKGLMNTNPPGGAYLFAIHPNGETPLENPLKRLLRKILEKLLGKESKKFLGKILLVDSRLSGIFRHNIILSLDKIMVGNYIRFIGAPNRYEPGDESGEVFYLVSITIPKPDIITAEGGLHRATVTGKAIEGARLKVSLNNMTVDAIASGSGGNWSVSFTELPAGVHTVSAHVIDITRKFADSEAAETSVTVRGEDTSPVEIVHPTEGATVPRNFYVQGKSADNAPIRVTIGNTAQTTNANVNGIWSLNVLSDQSGDQVLLVAEDTKSGKRDQRYVKIDVSNELIKVTRFAHKASFYSGIGDRILAQGYAPPESTILFYQLDMPPESDEWIKIATTNSAGFWEYNPLSWPGPLGGYFRVDNNPASLSVFAKGKLWKPEITSPQEGASVSHPIELHGKAWSRNLRLVTPDETPHAIQAQLPDGAWKHMLDELAPGHHKLLIMNESPEYSEITELNIVVIAAEKK
ncbi:Ig-like domain-containing protein [Serratia quinivorans]|uniref:hypothetical protein n=1 Tax=Serratia quinivorans TaxID=137545 RepID=UPI002177B49D|nr:hypothetical protein [Serratia quinivorans]CAI0969986.1 Uncharacterised protein [Serratia quinivorans]CAI1711199.1 Uncharacterised protein [Serratia quinivorans]